MSSIFDGIRHNKEFEKICKMTQKELKNHLVQRLNMQKGDGWAFREGTFPVLLTAHMDTVHKQQCKRITYGFHNGKAYATSNVGIGGDDRCGIYMILKTLEKVDCSVLFCEDEEIGSIGAGKFVKTDLCESLKGKFKYIIELDRANAKDAVFYDDDNQDFHKFVLSEYWDSAHGSWSDICKLSPALEISSVNFSCGYYNPHTTKEYVVLDEMEKSIEEVIKLLNRTDVNAEPFKFVEKKISYDGYGLFGGLYRGWYDQYDVYGDDYWDAELRGKKERGNTKIVYDSLILEVILSDGTYINTSGANEDECWANFFFENPTICFNDICDFYSYKA